MTVFRCKTCCMPNTRPDTPFIDGECAACRNYARRPEIDWEERKAQLCDLLDRHDGRVMVPSSGGKDSTYQVMKLLEMGAEVTIVTARTCQLTKVGRANIDNLARHARTIEIVPHMGVRARLNRLSLELVGDISWPEHAAIFSTPFRVAQQTGHRLIMYGENPQDQYGGPQGTEEARMMTRRWVTEFGGFLGLRPSDFMDREGITANDMADYSLPLLADSSDIEAHFLGQYIPWDSLTNARVALESGLKTFDGPPSEANWWIEENLDNAQTGIHDYFMFLKYGFGRGCQQISCDVRAGRIDRKTAMKWVEQHDGREPEMYAGVTLRQVLDHIGMTPKWFGVIAERFRNKQVHNGM
jgi:hypothetical protein